MDITVYNLPSKAHDSLKKRLSNIVDNSHIFTDSNKSTNKTYIEIKNICNNKNIEDIIQDFKANNIIIKKIQFQKNLSIIHLIIVLNLNFHLKIIF